VISKGFIVDGKLDWRLLDRWVQEVTDAINRTSSSVTVIQREGVSGGASSWSELTGKPTAFSPSVHATTHETDGSDPITGLDDFARLSVANRYLSSQTVAPRPISSSAGVVAWNLSSAQNAELSTTESISGWTVMNGRAGLCPILRLSVTGEHTITWTATAFYDMTAFQMPASGKVSLLSFRFRTDTVMEFLGQSPAFDEWEIAEKIQIALGLLAATGTGKVTRKATAAAALGVLSASGTGKMTRKASMSVALGVLSASGSTSTPAKLLLESEGFFLLESGDKLILE
jgi:hypothetical protein